MSLIALVDRGLELRARMERDKAELEKIEEQLEQAGLNGEQIDLVDAEREGKQFLAEGTSQIVPVVFTADLIAKSFQDGSAMHIKVRDAAHSRLRSFYKLVSKWEATVDSGKRFRALAGEVLGKDGPAFVSACLQRDKAGIPKSAIKVEWDRASQKAGVAA